VDLIEAIEGLLKCMKLPVPNAENNAKFLSDQQETDLFYAVIVLEAIEILVQEREILTLVLGEYQKSNLMNLIQNLIRFLTS